MSEIQERTDEELRTLTRQLGEDLYKLRVQKATNQLQDTGSVRRVRRGISVDADSLALEVIAGAMDGDKFVATSYRELR